MLCYTSLRVKLDGLVSNHDLIKYDSSVTKIHYFFLELRISVVFSSVLAMYMKIWLYDLLCILKIDYWILFPGIGA
jgi:hypothetical protein